MKQAIKVNSKYKLYQAISFLLVYIIFILLYSFVNGLGAGLFGNALVWGFSLALLYYILIFRTKILIDKDKLICKPANAIFMNTIQIQSIHKIIIKKRCFFVQVIVYYEANEKIRLYAANPFDFIGYLKDSCTDSSFEVENQISSDKSE